MVECDGPREELRLTLDTVMSGPNRTIYTHYLRCKCDTNPRNATAACLDGNFHHK